MYSQQWHRTTYFDHAENVVSIYLKGLTDKDTKHQLTFPLTSSLSCALYSGPSTLITSKSFFNQGQVETNMKMRLPSSPLQSITSHKVFYRFYVKISPTHRQACSLAESWERRAHGSWEEPAFKLLAQRLKPITSLQHPTLTLSHHSLSQTHLQPITHSHR